MTTIAMQYTQQILDQFEKPYFQEDSMLLRDDIDDAIDSLIESMAPAKLFELIWGYTLLDGGIMYDVSDSDPKVMLRRIAAQCVADAAREYTGWTRGHSN